MTEVPFSDASRGVATGFEKLRDRDFLGAQSEVVVGEENALETDPLRIAAGHERGSCGRAGRRGGVEGREAHALRGELVEVGGFDFWSAVATEIVITDVV